VKKGRNEEIEILSESSITESGDTTNFDITYKEHNANINASKKSADEADVI
jgi:hypothetical protein